MQSINNKIKVYQDSINNNNLSETYKYLIDYMNQLQREFSDDLSNQFIIRNLLNGYLDYSYFYLTNEYLKDRKLKLGITYNHLLNSFELWWNVNLIVDTLLYNIF